MENQSIKWQLRTDLAYDSVCEYSSQQISGLEETKLRVENVEIIKHKVDSKCSEILKKLQGCIIQLT